MGIGMGKTLKVLVHGTGFAGQGHTEAFRYAGAEVIGIVGRTESVVKKVAADLDISYAGTDWQKALTLCQPDIVSIATPGGAHFEPIKQAIAQGCHVFCTVHSRKIPSRPCSNMAVCIRDLMRTTSLFTAARARFISRGITAAVRFIFTGKTKAGLKPPCLRTSPPRFLMLRAIRNAIGAI